MKLSDVIEAYESSRKLGYDQSYEQFVRDLVNQPQILPIYDFLDNFFGDYNEGGIVSLFRRRAI